MSELTKQQLAVENSNSFPNNNTGFITPTLLRTFNGNIIDSLVDEVTYNADSASWTSEITALEQFSSSLDANFVSTAELNASSSTLQNNINTKLNTSSFNAYTASQEVISASFNSRINSVSGSGVNTGSLLLTASAVSNVITFTKGDGSTFPVTIATGSGGGVSGDFVTTSSFNSYTASAASGVSASINAATSSLSASLSSSIGALSSSVAVTNLAQSQSIAQLLGFSSSLDTTFATDAQLSASASTLQNDINTRLLTSSFQTYTSSVSTQIAALGTNKVNYSSPVNPQTITGSLIISGTSTNGGGETLALYGKGDGIALHVYSGSVQVTSPQGTGHFYTNLPITSSHARFNGQSYIKRLNIEDNGGAADLQVENNAAVSGNLTVSGQIMGSASYAAFALLAGSSSFATQALSSSYAVTASFALNAGGASDRNGLITTGSSAGTQSITGSIIVSGAANFTGGDFKVTDQGRNGEFDVDSFKIKTVNSSQFTGSLIISGATFNGKIEPPALSIGVTNLDVLFESTASTTASNVISQIDFTRLGAGATGDLTGVRLQTLSGSDTSGDTLLSRVTTGINRHTTTAMTGSVVNTSLTATWATGSAGTRVSYISTVNANAQSASATLTLTAGNAASNYNGGTASLQAGRVNIGATGATINITGSNPNILSGSLSGSLISNLGDIYTGSNNANFIITLGSASMASLLAGSATNANTLYFVI
jgi:hypothetical protein